MNDRFEIIKNMESNKYRFGDDYQKWGLELIHNLLEKINLDGWKEFENDTFQIVPYDWDGCNDCTCYVDIEIDKIFYSDEMNKQIEEFDNSHMHTIDCASHNTNFYHKPTGICVEWWKHVDGFKFINKEITFEDWEAIIEDCARSVLGDEYEKPKEENKSVLIVYAYDITNKSTPWIYGAYTNHLEGFEIQDKMQNSKKYGYLTWDNKVLSLK